MEEHIKKLVYAFLLAEHIFVLPVPIERIAEKHNIYILSYDKFAAKIGEKKKFLIKKCGKKAFIFYDKKVDKYIIVCDTNIADIKKLRFAITHELAHYFLQHVTKTNDWLLASTQQQLLMEKEANLFSLYLLSIPIILKNYHIYNPIQISNFCQIPLQQAVYIAQHFSSHPTVPEEILFKKTFLEMNEDYIKNREENIYERI